MEFSLEIEVFPVLRQEKYMNCSISYKIYYVEFGKLESLSRFELLTLTRPLRKKLRISADLSLIRQKQGTFLYKMM